jgi:hypothetical protein
METVPSRDSGCGVFRREVKNDPKLIGSTQNNEVILSQATANNKTRDLSHFVIRSRLHLTRIRSGTATDTAADLKPKIT